VRFLVLFSDKQYGEMIEMIEVAHEALIRNWKQLKDWLKECREALRKKRKIEDVAEEWKYHKKSKDYLLQGRSLRDAIEFLQTQKNNSETLLSGLAKEFVKASRIRQRQGFLKIASIFAIFPLMGTLTIVHFFILNLAQSVLTSKECEQNPEVRPLLQYMIWTDHKDDLEEINLCKEILDGLNFQKATLFKAFFKWAYLKDANFKEAYLREVNFQEAYLESVDFSGANLRKANLQGSILYRTNIKDAKNITEAQITQAKLCKVMLPKNTNLDPNRDCREIL
jgi:uncharacterized protein YjbI with pentapeptide repeats